MFQIEMPIKVTIELIMDDKGLYKSEHMKFRHSSYRFSKLQKTFHMLKNVILYVLWEKVEEKKKGNNLISLIEVPEGKREEVKSKFNSVIKNLLVLQQQ
jgi:hypothetical protein